MSKVYVNPQTGGKILKIPRIVLAGKYSASLSKVVVMVICSLPIRSPLGEETWEGTAPIINYDNHNAGHLLFKIVYQFKLLH